MAAVDMQAARPALPTLKTAPAPRRPPAELPEGFWYSVKRRVLGPPLVTEQLKNQRLSRPLALGVLSCDGLSSAAYGTEEILRALLPFFGLTAFSLVLPMTLLILFGVMLVVLSYREVVSVYTRAGGSYVVARENFGPWVAQVAAVALLIDYVVTVAVQTAAGSAAIVSAFPALSGIPVIGPKIPRAPGRDGRDLVHRRQHQLHRFPVPGQLRRRGLLPAPLADAARPPAGVLQRDHPADCAVAVAGADAGGRGQRRCPHRVLRDRRVHRVRHGRVRYGPVPPADAGGGLASPAGNQRRGRHLHRAGRGAVRGGEVHRGRLADRDHLPGAGVHADPPQPAVPQGGGHPGRHRRRPAPPHAELLPARRPAPGGRLRPGHHRRDQVRQEPAPGRAARRALQPGQRAGGQAQAALAGGRPHHRAGAGGLPGRLLHDHTADRIARRVSRVPGAAATIIPFDVRHKVETIHARRVRAAAHREPDPPTGADPIGSLHQRGRATVQGRLHAAEVRPGRHDSNVLACEVADSTGELTAVFYGRTQIAGLEPGRPIRLRGMVGIGADGRPAMVKPAYDLLA